jgi:hypothetical protein
VYISKGWVVGAVVTVCSSIDSLVLYGRYPIPRTREELADEESERCARGNGLPSPDLGGIYFKNEVIAVVSPLMEERREVKALSASASVLVCSNEFDSVGACAVLAFIPIGARSSSMLGDIRG